MKIGIIGYGSMGKMLTEKFSAFENVGNSNVYLTNRHLEKVNHLTEKYHVMKTNSEVAAAADLIFVCVRPQDIKLVLEEIKNHITDEKLVVSLNGSVSFALMEKVVDCKIAKMIPSVTAQVNRSETLICYNDRCCEEDKCNLNRLLQCMGEVIELPEHEMGIGSELVSCMPGFVASIFDVICKEAQKHTSLGQEQVVDMVLKTLSATGELMLEKHMTFENIVSQVATKGGITEEGTKVIYEQFPATVEELFKRTLEKRRTTAEKVGELF